MKFQGHYIQDIKTALTASAVSGHNVMLLSKPGWGKTDMARDAAAAIAGDGAIFLELDPSTPPEVIKGSYDPAALLNGKLVRVVDGTPYSPNAKIVILDELWRSSDVVADALIHATNQKAIDQTTRPVFWGTANFTGKAERTEALRDRFAMWLHLDPDLDVTGIINGHLNNGTGHDPSFTSGLPSWETCVNIRRMVPGASATKLITDMLQTLTVEAQKSGFEINPRRLVQWAEIVFRYSALMTGSDNFTTIPATVGSILQWCYPTTEKKKAQEWAVVCSSIIDRIGAALDAYRGEALKRFRETAKYYQSGNADGILKLGEALQTINSEVCALVGVDPNQLRAHFSPNDPQNPLNGQDPRIQAFLADVTVWFTKAAANQPID